MSAPTHRIKRDSGIWDTTPDQDGGCYRIADSWLNVSATDNRPSKIFAGDWREFKTTDGRTIWAQNQSYCPIGA